jgi:hypothetical protein
MGYSSDRVTCELHTAVDAACPNSIHNRALTNKYLNITFTYSVLISDMFRPTSGHPQEGHEGLEGE